MINKKRKNTEWTKIFIFIIIFLLVILFIIFIQSRITGKQIFDPGFVAALMFGVSETPRENFDVNSTAGEVRYRPLNETSVTVDGIDDYVSIPDRDVYSPNTTGELTVSFWFKIPNHKYIGISEGYVNPVNKNDFSPVNTEWTFRMYNDSSSDNRPCRTSFYIFNITAGFGIGSYFEDNQSANNCTNMDNRWINVVGMINNTNTFIFKDGVFRSTNSYAGKIFPENGNASVKLGYDSQSGGSFFNGSFDTVRIYNRSLTYHEIADIHSAGVTERITSINTYNSSRLNYSGYGGYIETGFSTSVLGNETTYVGWFYRDNNNSNHVIIGSSTTQALLLRLASNNALVFWTNSSGASASFSGASTNNNWTNFALVFNNSNGNATLYINGAIGGFAIIATRYTNRGTLWLGKRTAVADGMVGQLDEFSIYNSSLNATDIASIYDAGVNSNPLNASRVLHYNMDEGFGVNVADSAGSYNGTILGELRSREGVQWSNDGVITGNRTLSLPSTIGLVGHWRFNENQGTTAYDISDFRNNATLFNGTLYENDGINLTTLGYNVSISLVNITNALVYWSNLSLLSFNYTGNITTQFLNNDSLFILDNFNLTEGTSRLHSPIYFTSLSTSEKRATSNLSDLVNVTTTVLMDSSLGCSKTTVVRVNGLGRGYTISPSFTCSDTSFTVEFVAMYDNQTIISIDYQQAGPGAPAGSGGGGPSTPPRNATKNVTQNRTQIAPVENKTQEEGEVVPGEGEEERPQAIEIFQKNGGKIIIALVVLLIALATIVWFVWRHQRQEIKHVAEEFREQFSTA